MDQWTRRPSELSVRREGSFTDELMGETTVRDRERIVRVATVSV